MKFKLNRWPALACLAGALAVSSAPAAINLNVSPPPDTGSGTGSSPDGPVPVKPKPVATPPVVTPLRLTVELHDGSRIIGVPAVSNLQMRTSFGNVGVDLTRLRSLQFTEGKETVEAGFQNGDKFTGALLMEAVELKTDFGAVKIPVAVIRRMSVSPGGKGQGGLVLHYTFDEENKTTVKDQSGQGHDGKLNGAQWTGQGKKDGGVVISGGREEILVTNTGEMLLEDYTLSVWLKRSNLTTTSGGGYQAMFFVLTDKVGLFGAESDGRLYASGADNNRHPIQARIIGLQWHHVAVVKKGRTASFYLDGEPVGEVESGQPADCRKGVSIGGSKDGYPFVGTFDELMIFDRPLSEEEVRQLHNSIK